MPARCTVWVLTGSLPFAKHPRLAFLYVMAAMCYMSGRPEAAVSYSDAAQLVIGDDYDEVPYGIQGVFGTGYQLMGQPERAVEWCRAQMASGRDTHTLTRTCLVLTLALTGRVDEAMAAANGLIEAAEATHNPCAISFALLAYGIAFRDAQPDPALHALHRGLVIAQDSGNRSNETHLASALARLQAGCLPAQRGAQPGSQSEPDLVHGVVQCRTRRNHGGAILR
jgi:hypothetical protein